LTPIVTGPVPVTASSRPFRSSLDRASSVFVDLEPLGYVEEEYFLAGHADAIDPDGDRIAEAASYVTRVLVRRPDRVERFSGTVHLEPFHNLGESTPTWGVAHRHLTAQGDAWIGVTVSAGTFGEPGTPLAGGVTLLRSVDPDRYATLELLASDKKPPRAAPTGPGGYDPEEMRWRLAIATAQGAGIAAGLAGLVRGNHPTSPLAGFEVTRLYASGWSQTGLFWANFLDFGLHEASRAIDGYLVAVAPGPEHRPADAILVNLLSEAEVVGTLNLGDGVADDTDVPRFRGYEVPGSFHLWHLAFGGPFHTDDHGARHNDRPWPLLVHALLASIEAWSRDGTPMPHEPRITRDSKAPDGVARDEHGNARGGLRTPWLDVPSAQYLPRCECSPTVGEMRVFDDAKVVELYGTHAEHAGKWANAVDELVRHRWLLPVDAIALRAAPE
jgi:Alpha/beta hydrolase domain